MLGLLNIIGGYMKNFLLVFIIIFFSFTAWTKENSPCVECHKKVTPGIVEQHLKSKMFNAGVDCSDCHGSDHKSSNDFLKAKLPTPQTCEKCHPEQAKQFKDGKHNLGWISASSMPMWAHQPKAVVGEGYKGCSWCHKIGEKGEGEKYSYRYGNAQCDSCHTRHSFNKSEAQNPMACMTCHMGFDHPQWEMWSTSKHGTIWQIEGKDSKRVPTCQTCHMDKGNHRVMTAWGFLALRLPEDDPEWLKDRITILQALGVLDEASNPTPRLEIVKVGKVARLTKEEFQNEREKMLKICSRCHGENFARKQLEAGDEVVKEVDKIFAEAIREIKALYKEGILQKPEKWDFAPDLLQFYEAKSSIEQDLYLMFLEYRMRTFQGAFHLNPDYMHWYGWAPMKETLQKIKDEAKKLRKEKK